MKDMLEEQLKNKIYKDYDKFTLDYLTELHQVVEKYSQIYKNLLQHEGANEFEYNLGRVKLSLPEEMFNKPEHQVELYIEKNFIERITKLRLAKIVEKLTK